MVYCVFYFIHQHAVSDTQSKFFSTNVSKNVVRVFPHGGGKGSLNDSTENFTDVLFYVLNIYFAYFVFFCNYRAVLWTRNAYFAWKH